MDDYYAGYDTTGSDISASGSDLLDVAGMYDCDIASAAAAYLNATNVDDARKHGSAYLTKLMGERVDQNFVHQHYRTIDHLKKLRESYACHIDCGTEFMVDDDGGPDIRERMKRLTKVKAYVLTELNEYIATFTAPQCHQICPLMEETLPLELRGMIYKYIHGQPCITCENLRSARSSTTMPEALESFTPAMFASQRNHEYTGVANAQFLGAQTAEEFVDSWFGEIKFISSDDTTLVKFIKETCRAGIIKRIRNLIVLPPRSDNLECLMVFGPDTKISIHLHEFYWRSRSSPERRLHLTVMESSRILDVSKTLSVLRRLLGKGVIVTIAFNGLTTDEIHHSFEVESADLSVTGWAERLTDLFVACGPKERRLLTRLPMGHTTT